jgi:hypothetical protein
LDFDTRECSLEDGGHDGFALFDSESSGHQRMFNSSHDGTVKAIPGITCIDAPSLEVVSPCNALCPEEFVFSIHVSSRTSENSQSLLCLVDRQALDRLTLLSRIIVEQKGAFYLTGSLVTPLSIAALVIQEVPVALLFF